jgi:hypothetical protein
VIFCEKISLKKIRIKKRSTTPSTRPEKNKKITLLGDFLKMEILRIIFE